MCMCVEGGEVKSREIPQTLHSTSYRNSMPFIPYSVKVLREKTCMNFADFVAIRKSFLCKIWRRVILWCGKKQKFS